MAMVDMDGEMHGDMMATDNGDGVMMHDMSHGGEGMDMEGMNGMHVMGNSSMHMMMDMMMVRRVTPHFTRRFFIRTDCDAVFPRRSPYYIINLCTHDHYEFYMSKKIEASYNCCFK